MKKFVVLFSLIMCLLIAVTAFADDEVVELRFIGMAQAAYSEENVNDMTADFMAAHPNIKVETEFVPYEDLRNKTMLAYGSNSPYDAALVDDIWFAEYASKGMIADITDKVPQEYKDGVLEGGWNFVTKGGKIVGLPWFLDTMYLFYNKAMLNEAGFTKEPKSLEEMIDMGRTLKEKGIVEYPFVFSMAQAEALICVYANFMEAMGRDFQDADGNWIVQDTGLEPLNLLISMLNEGLINPNSTEYLEEDVRMVFSAGDAAFCLNWMYVYDLASDPEQSVLTKDQVGVMVMPGAEGVKEHAAMSGSMGLSVMSNSAHPEETLLYIEYLTSKELQDAYSNLQMPVWTASYDDPAIIEGREDLAEAAKLAFSVMNARPSVPNYQEASAILQADIQSALLGDMTAEDALNDAVEQMNNL